MAAVVGTLALGIGANTAVFSLVDAVILHPLAVANPERLVAIYVPGRETPYGTASLGTYRDFAARNSTFTGVGAYFQASLPLSDGDGQQVLKVLFVTENYFTILGVRAAVGRTLLPSDPSGVGANPVVVLSGALWRSRFGADRSIIGKQIHLHGQALTVVGVAPDRFRGTDLSSIPDAWVPVSMIPSLSVSSMLAREGRLNTDVPIYSLVGRLAPGVTHQRASADLNTLAGQAGAATVPLPVIARPGSSGSPAITVIPLTRAAAAVRDRATLLRFMRLLFGVVALTLLLACMNVANLLVVRAGERAKELGVRTALGASAAHLARQLLTESAMLALMGGAVGIAVAFVTIHLLSAFTLPGGIALSQLDLGLNIRVLVFTCVVSLLTAIGFGMAPALRATRVNGIDVLRQQDGGRPALRRRGALLAIQVAISLMLLVGAGLFLRSVRAGLNTDLGFDPAPLAAVSVMPKFEGRHAENVRPYLEIVAQMTKMPGVTAAAAATHVPLGGAWVRPFGTGPVPEPGTQERKPIMVGVGNIAGDYFKALGVPLLAGRTFTNQDGPAAQHVIILNESAARTFWPGESPLGKLLHSSGLIQHSYTVVGVVRDTKYMRLQDQNVPFAYVPIVQEDFFAPVSLIVRSSQPRAALMMLQQTVSRVAPDFRIPDSERLRPRLVSDQIDATLAPQRFGAMLLSVFSLVALCVAGIGIYGTVAYAVARRTTEIGIRMALGARRADVLSLVLTETSTSVAAGLTLGVVGAVFATKLLTHFLYGVTPSDWIAFSAAIGVVIVMAVGATLVPAGRAVRIDPVNAMRTS